LVTRFATHDRASPTARASSPIRKSRPAPARAARPGRGSARPPGRLPRQHRPRPHPLL